MTRSLTALLVACARNWLAGMIREVADLVEAPPDPDRPDATRWLFTGPHLHQYLVEHGVDRDVADDALLWLAMRDVEAGADLSTAGMGDQR